VEQTKNNRSRIVPIHSDLIPVLKEVTTLNGKTHGLYFFGGKNVPLCRIDAISKAFRRFAAGGTGKDPKRVLPEGITLHSLRHTFITYLLRSGVDLRTVQSIAGHLKITTTERYTHLVPGTETVEKLRFIVGDTVGESENPIDIEYNI